MTSKPTLHQFQVSPFSAKVRRVMYYKGIDFDVVNYGLSDVGKIKKLNARGKTPILEHNGKLIPDSTNIIEYIESIHPNQAVIPDNPLVQAQAHILEDWADESLYFYDLTMRCWPNNVRLLADDLLIEDSGIMAKIFRPLIPVALKKQASTQGTGRKDRKAICEDVQSHFDAINTLASHSNWLAGGSLSIADIAVVSMCTVLERADEAKAMMESLPALMAWRERVDQATLPVNTPADMKAFA